MSFARTSWSIVALSACSARSHVIDGGASGDADRVDAARADSGAIDAALDDAAAAHAAPDAPMTEPDREGVIFPSCGVGESSVWQLYAAAERLACGAGPGEIDATIYEMRCRDETVAGRTYRVDVAGVPLANFALLRGSRYLAALSGTLTVVQWEPGVRARIEWNVILEDGSRAIGGAELAWCPASSIEPECPCPPP